MEFKTTAEYRESVNLKLTAKTIGYNDFRYLLLLIVGRPDTLKPEQIQKRRSATGHGFLRLS
ncbi:protein of unknown function [Hyphomicrobium sp. MC1]|nr:protein of unknown function [Hyphomicrobium sp. MC1]